MVYAEADLIMKPIPHGIDVLSFQCAVNFQPHFDKTNHIPLLFLPCPTFPVSHVLFPPDFTAFQRNALLNCVNHQLHYFTQTVILNLFGRLYNIQNIL